MELLIGYLFPIKSISFKPCCHTIGNSSELKWKEVVEQWFLCEH